MPTFFVGGKPGRHGHDQIEDIERSRFLTMQLAGSKGGGGRPRTRGGRTADRRRPSAGQAQAPRTQASHARQDREGRQPREARQPRQSLQPRQLSPEIETELAGIAAGAGCELLHVEWKGGVLRLILDRVPAPAPNGPAAGAAEAMAPAQAAGAAEATAPAQADSGVSLGDCEQVAKQASALLDVLDFGGGRYVLEVSSPGLDRQLYRPSDYRRFRGRLARVTFETSGPAGRAVRRTVVARLGELSGGDLGELSGGDAGEGGGAAEAVTLVEARSGERITVRLADVRQARLELEL